MLKYINYSVIFFLFLSLLSCVPTRRFDSEVAARTVAEREALEANALAKESDEIHISESTWHYNGGGCC